MNRLIFLLVFLVVGVSVTYYIMQEPNEEVLPVINPIDLEAEMVDPDVLMSRKGYGHTIGNFSFLNQDSILITQKDVENKVFIAEYFFTTCGTICPIMNAQMQRVHDAYKSNEGVRILSFTVNPEVDNIERMKAYADEHGAKDNKWHFLTGEKQDLYDLARKSFFVLKPAEAENLGDAGNDFIHTNNFVLVDRKRRIRGYYDGTSTTSVDSLITDVGRLLKEF